MGNTDARDARDTGITQAADHADAVSPRWTDRAYDALVHHANRHTFFTVEQVRMAFAGVLPDPPSSRAWGAVVLKAARAGIVSRAGHTEAEDPAVHCNLVTLWRSNLRAAPPDQGITDAQVRAFIDAVNPLRYPMPPPAVIREGIAAAVKVVKA